MKKQFVAACTAVLVGVMMGLIALNPSIVMGAASGGAGAGNPEYVPSLLFPDTDVSPDETGELVYDNTTTGVANGMLAWYNGAAIKYLVDIGTLPSNDDYVVAYDADADGFYMKLDANDGGGGATAALDNLASVAINTSLVSDTANTDDLGTEAIYWKELFLASLLSFEGSTDDDYQTVFSITDPTSADKTVTFRDATGTVIISGDTLTGDVTATFDTDGSTATTIAADSVALTTDTTGNYVLDVADGTGIDGTAAGEGATYTPVLDLTEVTGAVVWNDGATDANFTWTYNLNAGTDPIWTIGDSSVDLSTGTLKNGGSAVKTIAGLDVRTPSGDQSLGAANAVTVAAAYLRVGSTGGAVTITATPSVANPTADGTFITIQGISDSDYVTLQDEADLVGSDLELRNNQPFTLGKGDTISLVWDSGEDCWFELSRADN